MKYHPKNQTGVSLSEAVEIVAIPEEGATFGCLDLHAIQNESTVQLLAWMYDTDELSLAAEVLRRRERFMKGKG